MNTYLSRISIQERFFGFLLNGLVLLLFSANLLAGTLNLAWDSSPSSNVGGYKLFYGTSSSNYTSSVDVGNQTNYQVTGLQDGTTYYFAAVTYDNNRVSESDYSNEIAVMVPPSAGPSTLPDVVVTDISYDNGIFTSTVKNQGSAATPSGTTIGVGYLVNGSVKTWGTVTGPLAAGESVTIGTKGGTYIMPSGTHTITAYVDDVNRFEESDETNNKLDLTLTIPVPVSADFTASTTNGKAPLIVSFTPLTTGNISGYQWTFGDTSIPASTSQFPTVTYKTPGTYSVSLTVTSSIGSVTKTKQNFITVTEPPPVANFSATPTSGLAPISVKFTDASTGNITDRLWDFGDGITSADVNPSHIYNKAGIYSVSLTVTGSGGSDTKISKDFINVSSGAVAAYGFEEVSGSKVADASGNGNHGTITGATRVTSGRYGRALKFDGKSNWVTVADSKSLDLSSSMTLEAWVYPFSRNRNANTVIFKEAANTGAYALYAKRDNALPLSYFNDGKYNMITGPEPIPSGQWTHLVSTYDGKTQRLYINGNKVAEQAKNTLIQASNGVLRIGGNSILGEYFKGYIDEVRIYSRALTATEISQNMKTAVSVSNQTQYIMGDSTLEPWVDYTPQGIAQAYQTASKNSGVVTKVRVYLDAGSTAKKLIAGIYSDENGRPGKLVAQGKLKKIKLGAWNSVSIPVTSVSANRPYWIAILGLKGQIAFLNQEGSSDGLMATSTSNKLNRLPRKWSGSVTKINTAVSLYGKGYQSQK